MIGIIGVDTLQHTENSKFICRKMALVGLLFLTPLLQASVAQAGAAENATKTAQPESSANPNSTESDINAGLKAVEQGDDIAAFQIFKPLAEQGDMEAQHNLAVLYKTGKGVMRDMEKAAMWFRKAAEQGLPDAQFNLGELYDEGNGVEKRHEYAALWYTRAAEQGHALAQTNLGVMYANGDGVPQDPIKAYVWFNLAASQGIGVAFDNREILGKQMSEDMLGRVREISRDYFQRFVLPFQSQAKTPHATAHKH